MIRRKENAAVLIQRTYRRYYRLHHGDNLAAQTMNETGTNMIQSTNIDRGLAVSSSKMDSSFIAG